MPLDRALLDFTQSTHDLRLDLGASVVSLAGDATVTAGLALGLCLARLRAHRPDPWVPLAIAATVVVEVALKLAIPQSPPPHELSRSIELVPAIHTGLPFAFPSGHLARSMFLLAAVRAPAWLVAAGFVLMALTRVYLAEHWPSDVLGGALLGLGIAWLARYRPRPCPLPSR